VRAAGGLDAGKDSFHSERGIFIVNEVRIEKWVYGGDGLARLDGRVVLAPFVLPGELARVDLGDDVRANLIEILEPAPERVTAPCPIFTRCGGCDYQHAPYEYQLARKAEILREQLKRVGKLDHAGEIGVVSGPPFGYRNRSQFHIANGRIGYLAARSHELVPVPGECPISSPRVNQVLALLRERLTDPKFPRFVQEFEVFTNETDVQINALEADRPLARSFYEWMGSSAWIDYAGFRVSPRSFFQVNRFLIDPLADAALEKAEGRTALDLYAGVGLFARRMMQKFEQVTAVESGASAVRDLEVNVPGVRFEFARVEDYLAKLDRAPDFVLADPPRSGLGKTVTANLARLRPPRITIVSCDPATLARDLAALKDYKIDRVTLVDLFPQTYHLETIVDLSL
jgi:23S rRNA (uracil1939-C5)-methyltransferase